MHRKLFVFAALLAALGASLQAHAVTLCTAGNPNTISVAETTPTSAFTDNGDGTVTHNLTGLMWKRCAEGQTWNGSICTGNATTFTWANALMQAQNSTYAGYSDWRLPNIKELESIVESCGYDPAINKTEFPATPALGFWSGSPHVPVPADAWVIGFSNGSTTHQNKANLDYVRLVRGGRLFDYFDAQKLSQIITFDPAPTLVAGGSGTVSASGGASGNPVTFSSITPGVCTTGGVNGSTVSAVTNGTCTIVAEQEGNASYNTAQAVALDLTIGAGAGASTGVDLTVSALSSTADGGSVNVGDPITITSTISNIGTSDTTPGLGIPVFYYVSTDQVITMSDRLLSGRGILSLGAGGHSTMITTVTLPSNLAPGTYYIGAIVDPANYHHETNETNNTRATVSSFTLVRNVDLRVEAVSSTADGLSNVVAGQSITISATVKNWGTTTTSLPVSDYMTIPVSYYLSTDNVITTEDRFIGSSGLYRLPAGRSGSTSVTVNLPAPLQPGTYYIGAIVDTPNVQVEINKSNNSKAAASSFTVVRDVDLTVSALTSSAEQQFLNRGDSITINATIANGGSTATTANTISLSFYLSTDVVITPADTFIGSSGVLSQLAAGGSANLTKTLSIPATLAPGTYYIGAIVDTPNAQPESNENNNATATAHSFYLFGNNVDLTVSALSSPAIGGNVDRGGSITISATVANGGSTATTATTIPVSFYLSTDNVITTADKFIGSSGVLSQLAAGGSTTLTKTLNIPTTLAPGHYYIGAIVDAPNAQPETVENNNSRATAGTINVLPSNVDLTVSALTSSVLGDVNRGDSMTLTAWILNTGFTATTATTIPVSFYLSADNVITTADQFIGSGGISGLGAGATATVSRTITIPTSVAPGTYYIGAIVDTPNVEPEIVETNNTRATTQTVTVH